MIVNSEENELYKIIDEIARYAIYRIAVQASSHKANTSDFKKFVNK